MQQMYNTHSSNCFVMFVFMQYKYIHCKVLVVEGGEGWGGGVSKKQNNHE